MNRNCNDELVVKIIGKLKKAKYYIQKLLSVFMV